MLRVLGLKFKPWFIIIIGNLFFAYQYALRVAPNVLYDELLDILNIEATSLGFLVGIFSLAYALMLLPLGIAMDRFGPKYLMLAGSIICAISAYIFGETDNYQIALIARFLIGMAASTGFLGCLKLGTLWLPQRHFGKVVGMTVTFGTIGAMFGGIPLRYLFENYNYQYSFHVMSLIGLVIAVLILLFVQNKQTIAQEVEGFSEEEIELYKSNSPLKQLKNIITKPQAWFIALYAMLMYAPMTIYGEALGILFLERGYNIEEKEAATIIGGLFLGAALGSPFFSLLSDFLKLRKLPMLIGPVVAIVAHILIIFFVLPVKVIAALFFIAGFCYTAKNVSFAMMCEIMPINMSGISIAFVNIFLMSAGPIFHTLTGYLMHNHWNNGDLVNGAPYYNISDIKAAIIIVPVLQLIAFICASLAKETHPDAVASKRYKNLINAESFQ